MISFLISISKFSCKTNFSTFSFKMKHTYEDTIKVLNGLISNTEMIAKNRNKDSNFRPRHIFTTKVFCERAELAISDIDNLNIIHIAGTKGKGSTCTYIEAILRQHGYKTGLFTSPHLKEVRERIKINGNPLSMEDFSDYFWSVYDKLNDSKTHSKDMPFYFQFLTILAFEVFVKEKVDFVILETGIGGRFDITNIISRPIVTCITALGYDHMELLGSTMTEIAWNKAGIIKPKSIVFTCDNQPEEGLKVIEEEVRLNDGKLYLVQVNMDKRINIIDKKVGIHCENVLLASAICQMLLEKNKFNNVNPCSTDHITKMSSDQFPIKEYEQIIYSSPILGRYQKITKSQVEYFIDGAHTVESIMTTIEWFKEMVENQNYEKRYLVFMITGSRSIENLLSQLTILNFDGILLTPLLPFMDNQLQDFAADTASIEREKCKLAEIAATWTRLFLLTPSHKKPTVEYFQCFSDLTKWIEASGQATQVLITGSLHLVGCALVVLS